MKEEDIQGVTSVRWTRAGYLITGGDDGVVRIWDTRAGGAALHAIKGHHASINYIDLSVDEDYIISGADDNFAALYGVSDKYNLYRDINKPDA
jgi:WD40 repeat protein